MDTNRWFAIRTHILFLGLVGLVAASSFTGCNRGASPTNASESESKPGKLDPEDSFKFVVKTFRRNIERPNRQGFRSGSGGASSNFTYSDRVTEQFNPPSKEGGVFQGSIIITTISTYSITHAQEEKEEKNSSSEDEKDRLDPADLTDLKSVAPSQGKGVDFRDSPVSRRETKEVQTYELEFQDGRWVLTTELDPDTERSLQEAFKHALRQQG